MTSHVTVDLSSLHSCLSKSFNFHSTQAENDYLYNYDCMTVSNLMVQKKG